ncbi:MAG: AMP phosphorylase [Nitrososphaera sp.]|nr:AMP phosphorylase [Nitrososphaera sp.]
MRLRVKYLGIESGRKPVVTLSVDDAAELGIRSGERLRLRFKEYTINAIVNIATKSVRKSVIGVYDEVIKSLQLKEKDIVDVEPASPPLSLQYIRNKLRRRKLNYEEILEIVKDTVAGNLSEVEMAAFVIALEQQGLDLDEATNLTVAMVETGQHLEIDKKPICDKHSIGGVPGDKTTLLVVPIVAAAGLIIPKTSSRAITSAAGTADRAEVLMPVNLSVEEMKRVVGKTNGCFAWGGSLHLAPADDVFVQVEYPLSIDPMLLPSIMAKKRAVHANFLAIDIPTGRGTKVKTIGDADLLAKDFIELGRRLEIKTQCLISYGEQPIGHAIGPALEAREALRALQGYNVPDLIDKAVHLCGLIFGMAGKGDERLARDILKSGKAGKKMREMIGQQGGNPNIKPDDIDVGEHRIEVKSERAGTLLWLDNNLLVEIARAAGAPRDKKAGILLQKKIGEKVKKGESVVEIYSEKATKLGLAEKITYEARPFGVGERMEMRIRDVKEIPIARKAFILER